MLSELLYSIELDTSCFLNNFYQGNPGVNEIYKLIPSMKTTYSSLSDEMVREDKKFKGNREIASSLKIFCAQFVSDQNQEFRDFSEAFTTPWNSV